MSYISSILLALLLQIFSYIQSKHSNVVIIYLSSLSIIIINAINKYYYIYNNLNVYYFHLHTNPFVLLINATTIII